MNYQEYELEDTIEKLEDALYDLYYEDRPFFAVADVLNNEYVLWAELIDEYGDVCEVVECEADTTLYGEKVYLKCLGSDGQLITTDTYNREDLYREVFSYGARDAVWEALENYEHRDELKAHLESGKDIKEYKDFRLLVDNAHEIIVEQFIAEHVIPYFEKCGVEIERKQVEEKGETQ